MKRGTLIAVGAFALLLGILLATREKQVQEGVKKLELPAVDKAKVSEIDLAGAHRLSLRRDGDAWKMEDPDKPRAHPADEGQVRSLLDELATLKISDIVTDRPERQAALDLDDAKGTVVKVLAEGASKPLELVIGSAANGGSYARKPGQADVYVALGRIGSLVRRPSSAWRKHEILSAPAANIVGIAVKPVSGTAYTLAKAADGRWQLSDPPAGFRVDAAAGQQLAQQISGLRAQEFADPGESASALGLEGAHDVAEAKLSDGKSVVLNFGNTAGAGGAPATVALRVDGDPQIYRVAPYSKSGIIKPLDELRDLTLLSFEPAKVKALAIHGLKPVSLRKDGADWKVVAPSPLPVGVDFDPSQVLVQLNRLKGLRAARRPQQSIPESRAGLAGKPLIELTLEDGGKQTLRFGKAVEGGSANQLYVEGTADKSVYEIADSERARFDTGIELFKKPPPPPSLDKIKGLSSLPPDIRRQLEAQLKQRAAASR